MKFTRNFCIIAHIDHGKSTLADRLLERTGAVDKRNAVAQYLDKMDLERERGITIKAAAVRVHYTAKAGQDYTLNLIDTPGHVDFHYEVSRALAACDAALLVVDASQGIQAQTIANALAAMEHDLVLIPVLNKIDLPNADPARVTQELVDMFGFTREEILSASAKTGIGIEEILEAVVKRCPPPKGAPAGPLRALVIDSWFDAYQGVVTLVRVVDGAIERGDHIHFMATEQTYEVLKVAVFAPETREVARLAPGDVGLVIAGIRDVRHAQVGDTMTHAEKPCASALPGFRPAQPIVYAGIFPTDSSQYEGLRTALEKLKLNDASFAYEPETSAALGFGFRCGFLGSLHLEIIQERLEREFILSLISTAPTVVYKVTKTDGTILMIANPAEFPDTGSIEKIEEPYSRVSLHAPQEYIGNLMQLCQERRGEQQKLEYIGADRVRIEYLLPLAELIFDFHDRLKSASRGYASLDYEFASYRPGDLVKLTILLNGEPVDALSVIVHREQAYYRGREVVAKLREEIPRQMFDVAVQAAIGNKVVARETVKALRKNVTAKCYGGDITRKRKLLEKQKEGKKRMKQVGSVEVPQEAFLAVLKAR